MDLKNAISLEKVNYPHFYLIHVVGDGDNESWKLWVYKEAYLDNPVIDREIIPNEQGLVCMKKVDPDGTKHTTWHKLEDVVESVKKALEEKRLIKEERIRKSQEATAHLDKNLIKKRNELRMNVEVIKDMAKKHLDEIGGWEALRQLEPRLRACEKELADFDEDYPEYVPVREKRNKKMSDWMKTDIEEYNIRYNLLQAERARMNLEVDEVKREIIGVCGEWVFENLIK
jgi:hypothetical protein